jgi:hypothetical protein
VMDLEQQLQEFPNLLAHLSGATPP